jgi:secondary thiamine-phosphate synthase enzyme
VHTTLLTINTGHREAVVDVTRLAENFVFEHADGADGLLHVFVPHATAGLAIIEVGSGSEEDLLRVLDEVLPRDDRWVHRHGSHGHGRSHVLPAWLPPYATIPLVDGRLALGTWQSICLVDLNVDNSSRQLRLSIIAG